MRRWVLAIALLGGPAGLALACFGPAIAGGEQFAYRDAANYYYPLHRRVQAEWEAGRWPLWAPEENGGTPLLGNPTAAVLYPGKVVFTLRPYPEAARAYVIGHVLLAMLAMLALLRHWGIGRVGATLGAMAFAFGGPVLFQTSNVIYLVGAAWLPLGIRAADRWLRLGRRAALAELSAVLAMQVLGGDPEAAYLLGVASAGYAVFLSKCRARAIGGGSDRPLRPLRVALVVVGLLAAWVALTLGSAYGATFVLPARDGSGPPPTAPAWLRWAGRAVPAAWVVLALVLLTRRRRSGAGRSSLLPMLLGLVASAAVAAAASSAQLLPVLEFIGQSARASGDAPHAADAFSMTPTQLIQLLWPNITGSQAGRNTFWLAALPPRLGHANVWADSVYLGIVTLALVPAGLGLRRGRSGGGEIPEPWRAWMVAVTAVALLGSLGLHGSPLWWAREVPGLADRLGPHDWDAQAPPWTRGWLPDGTGGVYWLLSTALPGFGRFRFPPKLMPFAVLGLAALAARGWDAIASGDRTARRRSALWSGVLLAGSLLALGASLASGPALRGWIESRGVVTSLGPVDADGAVAEARLGVAQAVAMLAVAPIVFTLAGRRPTAAGVLAVVVAAADLAAANARLVITVPQAIFDETPEAVSIIGRAERDEPSPGPFRIHRMPLWGAAGWGESGVPGRRAGFVSWSRRTLDPKYAITEGLSYTLTFGVTELYDYLWFFGPFRYEAGDRAARVLGVAPGSPIVAYPRRAFDLWTTRYFILPYSTRWDDEGRGVASFLELTERVDPPPDAFDGDDGEARERAWARDHDFQIRRNLAAYPRAWVVHEATPMPPVRGLSRADRRRPMEQLLFANDLSWSDPGRIVYDPRRTVWLEQDRIPDLVPYLPGGPPSARESVRVARLEPHRVELDVELERPGIVVLADVFYPGWALEIDGQPAPVLRANLLMRGAAVAAGHHTLTYSYRPASFRAGLVASAVGLVGIAALLLWSALPSGRRAGRTAA